LGGTSPFSRSKARTTFSPFIVFLVTVPLNHASPEASLAFAGNQQRLQTLRVSLFAMTGFAHEKGRRKKRGNPRANIKNISHPQSIDTWSTRGIVSLEKSVKVVYETGALLGVQGLQQKLWLWFVFELFRFLEKRGRLICWP